MQDCMDPRHHHPAVFAKYNDKRYMFASHFVAMQLARGFTLPPPKNWRHHGAEWDWI